MDDPRLLLRKFLLLGFRPRKRLSQVFLLNRGFLKAIARRIRELVNEVRCSTVVEIGAGLGNLTKVLADELSRCLIISIEIDERMTALLKSLQEASSIDIVIGDATPLLETVTTRFVAVGNLPYHITSDLLYRIVRSRAVGAGVTVQYEVAKRICAEPGTDSYGRLTVLIKRHFSIEGFMRIPSRAFAPRPEVDSAFVVLKRVREFDEVSRVLEDATRCLFSYRNKLALKAVRRCFPQHAEQIAEVLGSWIRKRVYELPIEVFESIARIIAEHQRGGV